MDAINAVLTQDGQMLAGQAIGMTLIQINFGKNGNNFQFLLINKMRI